MSKGHERRQFDEVFRAEALRGERIHWFLHWFLYGMALALSGAVFFIQGRVVGLYGMILSATCLVYNGLSAWPIFHDRVYPWMRYLTVTLNLVSLTIYTYFDAVQNSTLAPATTAVLLLYPVFIFMASLRMDRGIIVYTTFLSLLSINGLYFWFYPMFDPVIAPQIVSADILGQVYRSFYLMVCGVMMYTVPMTMRRMLLAQDKLARESSAHKRSAEQDPLTGIANRRAMEQELEAFIQTARETENRLALFFIDLDHFKGLNDTLGHDVGDELLRAVAADLAHAIRPNDMAARLGGDEFVILMDNPTSVEDVGHFATRLLHTVARDVPTEEGFVRITASIGVGLFPKDAVESGELLRRADEAMYQAKRAGKNGYVFANSATDVG